MEVFRDGSPRRRLERLGVLRCARRVGFDMRDRPISDDGHVRIARAGRATVIFVLKGVDVDFAGWDEMLGV